MCVGIFWGVYNADSWAPPLISYQYISRQWFRHRTLGHVAHAVPYGCRKGNLTEPSRLLKLILLLCP